MKIKLQNRKILLVTSNLHLTFQLVLILNKMGIKPYILGPKQNSFIYKEEIFCKNYIEYDIDEMGYDYSPAISTFSKELIEKINTTCKTFNIDILLPVDYAVMIALSKYENSLVKNIHLTPFLKEQTLRYLNNKWNFSKICTVNNIPHPSTQLLKTYKDVDGITFDFPIIVKPLDYGGGFGINILDSKDALRRYIVANDINLHMNPLLCQEYIEGKDLQVFVLARHGEILVYSMCFMAKKGKREFVQNDEVLEHCKKIIKLSNYDGVGLIDVRYDIEKKRYNFLEINLRFPASTLYHYMAGINYVELLLKSAFKDKDIENQKSVQNRVVKRDIKDILLIKLNSWLL